MKRFLAALLLALAVASSAFAGSSNPPAPRAYIAATKTFWAVHSTGSNANDCTTFATACQTIQGAVNKCYSSVDTGNAQTCLINIYAPALTYTEAITLNKPLVGGGAFLFSGQSGQALISVTGANALTVTNGAQVTLQNVKFQTTTSGKCIVAQFAAVITVSTGVEAGACANEQVDASDSGVVVFGSNYAISGGTFSAFHSHSQGIIHIDGITVTVTNTPAFSQYFMGLGENGLVTAIGTTWTGAATGPRFTLNRNSAFRSNTNNLTLLPGSTAGTVSSGATYDDYNIQTRSIASGSSDAATIADQMLYWNSASGAAKTQTLPSCTSTGPWQPITVIDEFGDANTQNITITASASTFDGAASKVITTAHGGVTVKCDGGSNYVTVWTKP